MAKVHLADIFAGARAGFHLDGVADGSDSGREVWFLGREVDDDLGGGDGLDSQR